MKIDGITVTDAKRPITIKITPSDIKAGDNKNPSSCAAARSLCRLRGISEARVHIGRTYILAGKRWLRYHTTQSLRAEIVSFDRGGNFEPGIYQLRPMSPSDRASGRRQGSAKDKRTKNARKRSYHRLTNVRQWGANR